MTYQNVRVPLSRDVTRRLRIALFTRCVLPDAGAIDGFVESLTTRLRANAPGAMGEAKRLVHDVAGHKIDGGLMDDTARRIARARVSDEGQEGVRAFLDKRKPRWAE